MRFVYLIGAADGENTLPKKIGVSVDPVARCRHLQAGSPVALKILLTMQIPSGSTKSAQDIEGDLHKEFSLRHAHGEWFYVTVGEVKKSLRRLHANFHVEPGRGASVRSFYGSLSGEQSADILRNNSIVRSGPKTETPKAPRQKISRRVPFARRTTSAPIDFDIANILARTAR